MKDLRTKEDKVNFIKGLFENRHCALLMGNDKVFAYKIDSEIIVKQQ